MILYLALEQPSHSEFSYLVGGTSIFWEHRRVGDVLACICHCLYCAPWAAFRFVGLLSRPSNVVRGMQSGQLQLWPAPMLELVLQVVSAVHFLTDLPNLDPSGIVARCQTWESLISNYMK